MLSFKFRQRCETLAIEWRTKLRRRAFDSLPASVLIEELDAQILTPSELVGLSEIAVRQLLEKDDWSAGIIWLQPLRILYNPCHSPTRHESNLMHEIAHVLLEHPMLPFPMDGSLPTRDPRHEQEASYLGGCLQIPRRALVWAVQSRYSITEIANHFGASEAMVQYRANVTGIQLIVPSI
ncbi:MAG: ImmA/IrrE family metallo-endopeptidase [Anaerolineaceae bacterium]|nr:ImmA/IrrE family metallo-endopeptidase [Anaerolineaceae bacterium]